MRCGRSMHESLRDLRPEMAYSWYMGGIGSDGFKQLVRSLDSIAINTSG